MRKTRPHPPKDRKVEDLRIFRRVIREAVRALDEADAPRWQDGVELTLAGRVRALVANNTIDLRLLRDALASSSVPLDGVHSSGAAASASGEAPSTSVASVSPDALRRPSTVRPGAAAEKRLDG